MCSYLQEASARGCSPCLPQNGGQNDAPALLPVQRPEMGDLCRTKASMQASWLRCVARESRSSELRTKMSKAEEFIEIEKCKRGRVEPPEWGGGVPREGAREVM
jgi:hypothetical protein